MFGLFLRKTSAPVTATVKTTGSLFQARRAASAHPTERRFTRRQAGRPRSAGRAAADDQLGRSRPGRIRPPEPRPSGRARRPARPPAGTRRRVTCSGLSGSAAAASRPSETTSASAPWARTSAHSTSTAASQSASPVPGASGRLRFAPNPARGPALVRVADIVREPPGAGIDVHAADVHVAATVEDRLGAVAVMGVDVDDRDPVGARAAERLRRDRRVVQVARPAVRGRTGVVAGGPAQRVRGRRAAGHEIGGGQRGVGRRPGRLATCRARPASSCRSRTARPARGGRPATGARRPGQQPGGRKDVRHHAAAGRARTGSRPPPTRAHTVARCSTSAASWTARIALSSCAFAGITSAPADRSASSSTVARSGTSVPGSHTPSQTSPSGSCSRQSGCHTTGMAAKLGVCA